MPGQVGSLYGEDFVWIHHLSFCYSFFSSLNPSFDDIRVFHTHFLPSPDCKYNEVLI